MADNEFPNEVAARESDLGDACEMVTEIVANRARGARDEMGGNSGRDLLAAVEEVESSIKQWRESVAASGDREHPPKDDHAA